MQTLTPRPGHVESRRDRIPRHGCRARVSSRALTRELRRGVLGSVAVTLVLTTGAAPPVPTSTSTNAARRVRPVAAVRAAIAKPALLARPVAGSLVPRLSATYPGAPARRLPPKISAARGGSPLRVVGPTYVGRASWYGPGFQGRRTANGERFDPKSLTAAHKTLPFDTWLRVCRAGRCVIVRVNDRGPYVRGRFLDLSRSAAQAIGLDASGVGTVSATVIANLQASNGSGWATARG